MFNPTRDQARAFLFDLWEKHRAGSPLTGLESMALAVILEHPEYHAVLEQSERHMTRDWFPEAGETNPFLHMSMHLALAEQLSIDQPAGIRAQYQRLSAAHDELHDADIIRLVVNNQHFPIRQSLHNCPGCYEPPVNRLMEKRNQMMTT